MTIRSLFLIVSFILLLGWVNPATAMEGETTTFAALGVEKARLKIHAAADLSAMKPLIQDFQTIFPDTAIEYTEYITNDLQQRAEKACNEKETLGDIIISSSLDQLVKLANDGCVSAYKSAETEKVEEWANWRNEVYGFTFEPAVFVYNVRFIPPGVVPRTHAALADLLRQHLDFYRGKIGTFDIRYSGVGYQLAFADAKQPSSIYGRLMESMSRAHVKIHCCTNNALEAIARGELYFGYNIIGSYAVAAARQNPDLKIVIPRDYTLILSRGVVLPNHAINPKTGRRFVDYLLSGRGQKVAQEKAFFFSQDAPLPKEVDGPAKLKESGIARPIHIEPSLLAMQDTAQRRRFIEEWSKLMIEQPAK